MPHQRAAQGSSAFIRELDEQRVKNLALWSAIKNRDLRNELSEMGYRAIVKCLSIPRERRFLFIDHDVAGRQTGTGKSGSPEAGRP